MMHDFELCFGTIRQASLTELIEVAGVAGFQAITVTPYLFADAGISGAEARRRLRNAGVRVTNIDGFSTGLPGIPTGDAIAPFRNFQGRDVSRTFLTPEEDFYRAAEALEAESINLIHFGGDPDTPLDAIAEAAAGISERARRRGLNVVIEFLPRTAVPDIHTAARLVDAVGAKNFGVMLDTRHLARTGGSELEVRRYAAVVGAIQLSDLRLAAMDDPNRLLPGDGDLPLAEMLSLVLRANPHIPIGIEIYSDEMVRMAPRDAAIAAARSLQGLVDQALVRLKP